MALTNPISARDRLGRLADYVRKATRYWWIIAALTVLGGALSVVFASTRPLTYKSWSVLFYQERIASSLMSGREGEEVQRNIGDHYREMLLARSSLAEIVTDPKLNPFPEMLKKSGDVDEVCDELRLAVTFETRGANTFRISFTDTDRDRVKAGTDKLTAMMQRKEEEIRTEKSLATSEFAKKHKAQADADLNASDHALSEFLAAHPEFAQDVSAGGGEGAGIRGAKKTAPVAATGNPRILALERQRQRINARLTAPADAPPVQIKTPHNASPERAAADAAVNQAQRELDGANRALEEARSKYTEQYPDTVKAREAVAAAQTRLRRAQADVPADPNDVEDLVVAPATAADREALQKELAQLDDQLSNARAADQATKAGTPKPAVAEDPNNWIVQLETQYSQLKRDVTEKHERSEALSASVLRTSVDADQQSAEQGSRLMVVDPAFRPAKPFGKTKTVMVGGGLAIFFFLGLAICVILAIIDDRLYRRADVDELELVPVLAVIPSDNLSPRARRKLQKKRAAAARMTAAMTQDPGTGS